MQFVRTHRRSDAHDTAGSISKLGRITTRHQLHILNVNLRNQIQPKPAHIWIVVIVAIEEIGDAPAKSAHANIDRRRVRPLSTHDPGWEEYEVERVARNKRQVFDVARAELYADGESARVRDSSVRGHQDR